MQPIRPMLEKDVSDLFAAPMKRNSSFQMTRNASSISKKPSMRKDTSKIEKGKNSKQKKAFLEMDEENYYIDEEQEAQLMRQASNRSFRAQNSKLMSNLAPLQMQPMTDQVPMYSDGPYFGNPHQQPMMFVPFTNQSG